MDSTHLTLKDKTKKYVSIKSEIQSFREKNVSKKYSLGWIKKNIGSTLPAHLFILHITEKLNT